MAHAVGYIVFFSLSVFPDLVVSEWYEEVFDLDFVVLVLFLVVLRQRLVLYISGWL